MVDHPPTSCVEVVNPQEQPDSTCVLAANGVDLCLAIGFGEKEAGLRLRRSNDDPTLRASVIRPRRRVFDKFESQGIDEEPDGVVVVLDDQGRVLDMHTADSTCVSPAAEERDGHSLVVAVYDFTGPTAEPGA